MYKVSISGTEVGYVQNKEALEERVKTSILDGEERNVDVIEITTKPEYELKLVDRTIETKEEEMMETIKQGAIVIYKYYDIALNNEAIDSVDTLRRSGRIS